MTPARDGVLLSDLHASCCYDHALHRIVATGDVICTECWGSKAQESADAMHIVV